MSDELSPELRDLISASRAHDAPTSSDRDVARRGMIARVGIAALATTTTAATAAATATATAAGTTATVASGAWFGATVAKGALLTVAVAGTLAGGATLWRAQRGARANEHTRAGHAAPAVVAHAPRGAHAPSPRRPDARLAVAPTPGSPAVVSPPAPAVVSGPIAPVEPVVAATGSPARALDASSRSIPSALRVRRVAAMAPRTAPIDLGGPELAVEIAGLRHAHAALRASQPAQALAALDALDSHVPGGAMREERLAARALALCALGRAASARALAAELARTNPRSPVAARVAAACGEAPTDDSTR